MNFLAIVAWTDSNRLTKYQPYATQAEADSHVTRVLGDFPGAFVTPHPGGIPEDWLIDGAAQTVIISQSADVMNELKQIKKELFKAEAVVRMAAQVPAWNSFERIEFLVSISNLLNGAALTAAQRLALDILEYARDTVPPKIAAVANQAALDAIDPTAADPFGDGTAWPT